MERKRDWKFIQKHSRGLNRVTARTERERDKDRESVAVFSTYRDRDTEKNIKHKYILSMYLLSLLKKIVEKENMLFSRF